MNRSQARLTLVGLSLAASVGLWAGAAAQAAKTEKAPPDLSGTWQINEDLSRAAQQEMRKDSQEGPGGRHGGMGGRGGGRGGGMGRRGGGGGGFPPGGGEGGPRGGAEGEHAGPGGVGNPGENPAGTPAGGPPGFGRNDDTVTLAWAAPQLTVTFPGDRQRTVFADDRKVKEEQPGGKPFKTRAHWTDSGSLEIVTKLDDGVTRTEILELSNDGRRLFVIVGIEGRGPRPLQFRRVYDRVEKKEQVDRSEDEGAPPLPA